MARSTFWKQFGISILASMVAVFIIWLLAALISPDIRVDTPTDENQKLEWFGPSLALIFPYGIGAAIAAWLFVRFQIPRLWWFVVSIIALVVFGAQAFAQANTAESAIWLNIMHLASAAIIVPVVARFLPRRRQFAT